MTGGRIDLATEVATYTRVRAEIAAAFGLDNDDNAVIDTAEGETSLADYLGKLMREARLAEAQAKGTAELIKGMQERKARLEAKGARIRGIVLNAMLGAQIPKLTPPDFTVSVGRGQPSVVISDPTAIPERWCRVKVEPNLIAIRDALKAGDDLGFAHLSNAAPSLTVRST